MCYATKSTDTKNNILGYSLNGYNFYILSSSHSFIGEILMSEEAKQTLKADFCVIGAGSGGLSFAAGAAQMGASVILLEKRKMGGDCLNYGCIPSKALLAAAKFGYEAQEAKKFGWKFTKSTLDYKQIYDHIHSVIRNIAPHDSVERFTELGCKVILEEGKFYDESTIETANYYIKAKRFIIATGSSPFIPEIPGLAKINYYTNETIFDLTELPSHLVVIGGGPIGIEMAQGFIRLGSKVTVLESFTALPKDDQEITTKLKEILVIEGISLNENIKISAITKNKDDIAIAFKDRQDNEHHISASHVLVATGRRANIQNLNLEAAKIKSSPRSIEANEYLQTSNPKIYAIGDCSGGYQFTHVAGYHAGLVIRNSIFKLQTKLETKAIPWVTYTDPELAHVGEIESQLKNKNIEHKVLRLNLTENDRAQTELRTEGMIKVLVSPKGHILGATILGINAGELIYPWVIAMQNKLKISAIANSIAPYPTLNDINKRIAGSFYADQIFSPFMKRLVKFIMWFGK